MRVMLGYDPTEDEAYRIARFSIERRASAPVHVSPIVLDDLRRAKLYTRPTSRKDGQLWDIVSDAPMSTEFAISRFFIPHLVDSDDDEWVLFADSDIVCQIDVAELFALANPDYPLMCVQHSQHSHLWAETPKKVNKPQLPYPFKNWSSVMLWNVRHPAHSALTLEVLNTLPGRELHAFCWLSNWTIGILPPRFNWLVNVEPEPDTLAICHFTLGGPWLQDWPARSPYDHIWLEEQHHYYEATRNRRD